MRKSTISTSLRLLIIAIIAVVGFGSASVVAAPNAEAYSQQTVSSTKDGNFDTHVFALSVYAPRTVYPGTSATSSAYTYYRIPDGKCALVRVAGSPASVFQRAGRYSIRAGQSLVINGVSCSTVY